jgi:hypothetical protein
VEVGVIVVAVHREDHELSPISSVTFAMLYFAAEIAVRVSDVHQSKEH